MCYLWESIFHFLNIKGYLQNSEILRRDLWFNSLHNYYCIICRLACIVWITTQSADCAEHIHIYLFIVFLEMMTNEIAGKALPVSTAGFISDHRVLYLIYKPVNYFDGSPYRDIYIYNYIYIYIYI